MCILSQVPRQNESVHKEYLIRVCHERMETEHSVGQNVANTNLTQSHTKLALLDCLDKPVKKEKCAHAEILTSMHILVSEHEQNTADSPLRLCLKHWIYVQFFSQIKKTTDCTAL